MAHGRRGPDRSGVGPGGLRPLTARSVILSMLLGTHPARLPVRVLVRLGDLFEISEGTLRVALSRMAADGEVHAGDGWYELSPQLLARQRRLDEGRTPGLRPWRGRWELAVVIVGRPGPARSELLEGLAGMRLKPLRDGIWLRPANLARAWPAALVAGCDRFDVAPDEDPAGLAARLWDLRAWGAHGDDLLGAFEHETAPAGRFALAAATARHLRTDPVLPAGLLPDGWPGPALRRAYRAYEAELRRLLNRAGPGPGQ